MWTLAVMSNPGNMSDADLAVFILIMCVLACGPVVMALCVLIPRLIWTGFKWVVAGVFAYLCWKVAGKVFNLDYVRNFKEAFTEAYNKNKV